MCVYIWSLYVCVDGHKCANVCWFTRAHARTLARTHVRTIARMRHARSRARALSHMYVYMYAQAPNEIHVMFSEYDWSRNYAP